MNGHPNAAIVRDGLEDVAASEDHAYAAVLTSGTRDGRVLEAAREVFVCHLREGRVTEVWDLALDQSAVNEFWA
jgi:ketosteroid isomerase-like protein